MKEEFAVLRGEMRDEMTLMRGEMGMMRTEMSNLLRGEMALIRGEIAQTREEMAGRSDTLFRAIIFGFITFTGIFTTFALQA